MLWSWSSTEEADEKDALGRWPGTKAEAGSCLSKAEAEVWTRLSKAEVAVEFSDADAGG